MAALYPDPRNSCAAAFLILFGCGQSDAVYLRKPICPLVIEQFEPIARAEGWSLERRQGNVVLIPPRGLSGDELYRATGGILFRYHKMTAELC